LFASIVIKVSGEKFRWKTLNESLQISIAANCEFVGIKISSQEELKMGIFNCSVSVNDNNAYGE
jgi:hypothetical protein